MHAETMTFENDVVLTELKGVGRLNSLAISAMASGGVASLALLFGVILVTAGT